MQHRLLCEQRLANVWRRRSFRVLSRRRLLLRNAAFEAAGRRVPTDGRGAPAGGAADGASIGDTRAALQARRAAAARRRSRARLRFAPQLLPLAARALALA